jgi:tetratricopeptide (TPR) repeat protein
MNSDQSDNQQILSKDETNEEITQLNREAEKALRKQNFKEAKSLLKKALSIDPDHINSLINMGRYHQSLSQQVRAFIKFNKAESLFKNEINNYEKTSQGKENAFYYNKLSGMYLKLGTILFMLEKYKGAMTARKQAKELMDQAKGSQT